MKPISTSNRIGLLVYSLLGASFLGTSIGTAWGTPEGGAVPWVSWYCLAVSAVFFLARGAHILACIAGVYDATE
jgi:hypothetical protein